MRMVMLLVLLSFGAIGCGKQSSDIAESASTNERNEKRKLNMEFLEDSSKKEYMIEAIDRIRDADSLSEEERKELISEVFNFYSENNLGGLSTDDQKQQFSDLDQRGKLLFLELQLAIYAEASGYIDENQDLLREALERRIPNQEQVED